MTVEQRGVIDFIEKSRDGRTVSLVMLEDRNLDDPAVVEDTMAKIDTYMEYVVSGQIRQFEPTLADLPVVVEYTVVEDPSTSPALLDVLVGAKAMFAQEEVGFAIRHLNLPVGRLGSEA